MTLLQPHLGDMRHQELRNSPFWLSSLFKSKLAKEGKGFLLKKGTSKDSQGFRPYQNKPFCGPYRKEAPTGNAPMWATPHKSVTNHFPQSGGNRTTKAPGVIFDLILGDKGVETPPPMTPYKPSLIRAQSQKEAQVNTQAVVDLTQSLWWIINQEKYELKPAQMFSFVGYEYHLDSALVKPTQERWLKLQDLILQLKLRHVLTARCLMSLMGCSPQWTRWSWRDAFT